ncbi:unnamed protein product, partial [Heterosigma akashiwo]
HQCQCQCYIGPSPMCLKFGLKGPSSASMILFILRIVLVSIVLQEGSAFSKATSNDGRVSPVVVRRFQMSYGEQPRYKLKSTYWRHWRDAYTDRLQAISEESRSPEVLAFGDAFYDIIATKEAAGLSAEEMLEKRAWERQPGGESFNVALALAKLGTPTAFAGALGSDRDGRQLYKMLQESGVVGTELVRWLPPARPTRSPSHPAREYARRVLVAREGGTGEPVFSGFARPGVGAPWFADAGYRLSMEELEATKYHKTCKWVIAGTIGLAYKDSFLSHMELVRWTQKHNIALMVDVNWRPQFWQPPKEAPHDPTWEARAKARVATLCGCADVLKLTAKEGAWLTGRSASDVLEDPSLLREHFPQCQGFLVTNGGEEVAFDLLGCAGYVAPPEVPHVDEIGAGDAF